MVQGAKESRRRSLLAMRKSSDLMKDVVRIRKASDVGVSTGSKRASFDLTRNYVEEKETTQRGSRVTKENFSPT